MRIRVITVDESIEFEDVYWDTFECWLLIYRPVNGAGARQLAAFPAHRVLAVERMEDDEDQD